MFVDGYQVVNCTLYLNMDVLYDYMFGFTLCNNAMWLIKNEEIVK